MKMMKAAVLTLDGFDIQSVTVPPIAPDQVLIKTSAVGICSGDLFVYENRADFVDTYNRLGHEASGVVVEIGGAVSGVQVGDVVTSMALPAYAEYFVDSAENVVKLNGVDPNYALGEAIACCVHAANRFGIRPGDSVAIIGCGFMGLVCQQLAAYRGATFICGIDPIAERRAMSEQLGAQVSYDPGAVTGEAIAAIHNEFDVVIEAAGVQSAIDFSTALVAEHGRIVLVGYHQSNDGMRSINMQQWNYKAIDVVNGHVRREGEKVAAMQEAVDLMRQGHIETKPFTSLYAFDDIEQAFRDLSSRKQGVLKAVLQL